MMLRFTYVALCLSAALLLCVALAPGVHGACDRSSIKGYNYSVPLNTRGSTGNFKLHWRVAGQKIFFALQALPSSGATSGWVSVGWSTDGKMKNADAVVGNLAGAKPVQGYYLEDHKKTSPTTSFAIGATPKVVSNAAGLIVSFARAAGTGSVPVSLTGSNNIIFAYSTDNSKAFKNHGRRNKGSAIVNFSCK